jgi:hypothetical protein
MVVRKDMVTDLTESQLQGAVRKILALHKIDYKLVEDGYYSIKMTCKTGYSWGIIAEVMWDEPRNDQMELMIECRGNPEAPSSASVQKENADKYIRQLSGLITKYGKPESGRSSTHSKRKRGYLALVFFLVMGLAAISFFLYVKRT